MYKVAVIIGSDSDYPTMKPCLETLASFGLEADLRVISAHRTPELAHDFSANARERGYCAIIAAAGKAAHLAGVLAASTTLPVIGVPVKSSTFDGMDALLSTVQMPAGIPVATVAVDGAANAALLAVEMLAITDECLADKLAQHKKSLAEGVAKKEAALLEKINENV